MTPRSLADSIVMQDVEFYSDYDRTAGRSADLAAIDLARMDDLGAEIDESCKMSDESRGTGSRHTVSLERADLQSRSVRRLARFLHEGGSKRFGKDSEVGRACADVIEYLMAILTPLRRSTRARR